MLRIRLLGDFGVVVDGQEVAADRWPGRRAAELVQLLSLSDGHRLVRDQVIEALWPHLPAEAGAANLRKAAHHARRALDDADAVVLRGGQVALFPSCARQTDVAEFEAGADDASTRADVAVARAVADTYAGCSRRRCTRNGLRPPANACDPGTWRSSGSAASGSGWWRSNPPTRRRTAR